MQHSAKLSQRHQGWQTPLPVIPCVSVTRRPLQRSRSENHCADSFGRHDNKHIRLAATLPSPPQSAGRNWRQHSPCQPGLPESWRQIYLVAMLFSRHLISGKCHLIRQLEHSVSEVVYGIYPNSINPASLFSISWRRPLTRTASLEQISITDL